MPSLASIKDLQDGNSVPEPFLDLLRHLDGSMSPFLPHLALRLHLGARVTEALFATGSRFALVSRLAELWSQGAVEPSELTGVLRVLGIHPLSLVLALEDVEARPSAFRDLGVPIPGVWRELLGFTGGADGPPPVGLTVPGILELVGHPDLTELPARMALEGGLALSDLPRLRWLPPDLWFDYRLRIARCQDFLGWADVHMADEVRRGRLRRRLALAAETCTCLHVESCPSFHVLPPHLDLKAMLAVVDCPSFRKLPHWPGIYHLSLERTLQGVKRLKSPSPDCFLELEAMPDLEVLEGPFSAQTNPEVIAVGLPRLRTIRESSHLAHMTLWACPALTHLSLGPNLRSFYGIELARLRILRGAILENGRLLLQRCPSLRTLPKLPKEMWDLRLRDCPRLKRLPRSFEGPRKVIHSGPRPSRAPRAVREAWSHAQVEGRLVRQGFPAPSIDPFAWYHRLAMAPTDFARVRVLAEVMRERVSNYLLKRAFATYRIHPISVLYASVSPADFERLAGRLVQLSPTLEDLVFDPKWCLTGDQPSDVLAPSVLELPQLKVTRSAVIESLALPIWPKGLQVEYDLTLRTVTQLRALPDRLHVAGDLVLEELPDLESLPDELTVEGGLRVRGTPRLLSMPRLLHVQGAIEFEP